MLSFQNSDRPLKHQLIWQERWVVVDGGIFYRTFYNLSLKKNIIIIAMNHFYFDITEF